MPARRGPALLLQDSSRDPRARRAARANRNGGIESCFARSSRTGRTVRKRTPASTRWHRPSSSSMKSWACAIALTLACASSLSGQYGYFGQNKIQYRRFDWRVLRGEHVDLYYYPEEEELGRVALAYAEES